MTIKSIVTEAKRQAQAERLVAFKQFMTEQFGRVLKEGDVIDMNDQHVTNNFEPTGNRMQMMVVSVGLERAGKTGAISLIRRVRNDRSITDHKHNTYALPYGKTVLKRAKARFVESDKLLVKEMLGINCVEDL